MTRIIPCLVCTTLLLGLTVEAAFAGTVFHSDVAPVAAPDAFGTPQIIADELGAGTEWDIERGRVSIKSTRGDEFKVTVRVRGLVVPLLDEPFPVDPTAFPFPVPNPARCSDFGFPPGVPCFGSNPSPFFLARVVCHDEAGAASVAATTKAVPLSQPFGDGRLADRVTLPDPCFAPIVLIGGALPDGSPGRWFAVSGF